ncbi:MAG: redox-regulated ATPase YchF [Candidatus Lightella neohaematopini]|nr:redox-regulated ATPase YchF [Candidatus Lightella neohaematopini]
MNIKCGIIGLPNIGKSTLFNLLTNSQVRTDNYPFCTINPNIGIVDLYDPRLYKIADIINISNILCSRIQLIDTAGLIKNAANGIGLGEKILEQLYKVNIIYHVVRNFKKNSIHHVYNRISPIEDINIINMELILYDLIKCENLLSKLKYNITNENIIKICNKLISCLNNNKMLKTLEFSDEEKNIVSNLNFITLKPMIYIFNCDDTKTNVQNISNTTINYNKDIVININFLKEKNINFIIKKSTLDKTNFRTYNKILSKYNLVRLFIHTFNLLNIITFFTFNDKEIKSWMIKRGTTALTAAKKIHSDIYNGFIKVKVINYNKFVLIDNNKFQKLNKIPYAIYNKHYSIMDGDILKFVFR